MNRQVSLLLFAVLLGGAYVYFFTDWLRGKPPLEVYATVRPSFEQARQLRNRHHAEEIAAPAQTYPVAFTLKEDYKINEIKVVLADDFKTNKYPHAVWHMIADTASEPLKGFTYGSKIRGMKPSFPRGKAEALQSDVTYLLLIEAGDEKGQVTFKTKSLKPA